MNEDKHYYEPTHCYSCGVYLMGGATKHRPGCEVLRLIEQAFPPGEPLCHCGQPLHYTDDRTRAMVESLIAALGERMRVTVGGRTWLVPRHYIALHGIRSVELPLLGFEEVADEQ